MNIRNKNRLAGAALLTLALSLGSSASGSTLDPLSVQFLQGTDVNDPNAVVTPQRDIRVDIWTDVPEDEVLSRSEEFTLHVQTNTDLYVVVYKIDVEGRVEVLWPSSRYSDGFIYGNHTYSIPRPGQAGRLRVGNVRGVEYIEAIASAYPFDLRALGIDFSFDLDDRTRHDYYVDGDPFLAVNDINYAITGLEEDVDYVVTDWLHLYVESQVDYARYSCNQCHLDDAGYATVTPYVDTCSQVEVRVDWGWHTGWYVNFGWYPLYYEPPFYYWDYYWSRPYWYAWYPVPYAWPAYSCYTRPYPVYWWESSGYWRGDYASRWSKHRTRSVPLYDVARVSSRTISERGPDGTQRTVTQRPVSARGSGKGDHDGRRVDSEKLARNSTPPRQIDRSTSGSSRGRGVDVGAIRDPGESRGAGIRTDRGARTRITSKSPAGATGRGQDIDRSPTAGRNGDSGRRWTRPRVQNEQPSTRSGPTLRSPQNTDRNRDRNMDRNSGRNSGNVDRSRGGSANRGGTVDRPRTSTPQPAPRSNVDRSKQRSSSGSKGSAVAPRQAPRPQPKPAPSSGGRSGGSSRGGGSGSSRSRGGGGRG